MTRNLRHRIVISIQKMCHVLVWVRRNVQPQSRLGNSIRLLRGALLKTVQDVPVASDSVNPPFFISPSHFWQETNCVSRVFNTMCSINLQEIRLSGISKTFQLHSLVECGLPVPHEDEVHCLESVYGTLQDGQPHQTWALRDLHVQLLPYSTL